MTSRTDRDDDGLTLVELVIYIVVAGILVGIISSIFINGWLAQNQSTERDAATGTTNAVTASLQQSIRNASSARVDDDGNALRALVALPDGGWQCRAWVHTDDDQLKYTKAHGVIDIDDTTGWATLAEGISPTSSHVFTAGGAQVGYTFTVDQGDTTVPVHGTVAAQAVIEGGGGPCW